MSSHTLIAAGSLVLVVAMMLAETWHSRRHEAALRRRGAVEPPGDVYRTMQWAYPLAFVAMAAEGAIAGPAPGATTLAGAATLVAAKALKLWAIASLGQRWTFRVLILPGAPLVTTGPYAFLRHPNYVAVAGELVGMALLVGAPVTGPLGTVLFGWLLWRRIRVEERALRHSACT
jgi:methyltransferase